MEYPKFKVCCSCFTFNHAKFITDTMNGFTMQQTSFPFVCTIVDDASTDGEQEVIKQYVEDNFDFSKGSAAFNKETDYAFITYAQHKTNKNCYFAVLYLKENHYSQRKSKMGYLSEWRDMCEYEAFCEGDDYWIDSSKLRKQIEILESDANVMMVHTAFKYLDEDNIEINSFWFKYNIIRSHSGFLLPEYLYRNIVQLVSCVIRLSVLKSEIYKNFDKKYDYLYFLTAASLGKVIYINEYTCCYRSFHGSITHTRQVEVQKDILSVTYYFTDLITKGIIKLGKLNSLKTNLYIGAKGFHMLFHGQGINYLYNYILKTKKNVLIIPCLFWEVSLTLHYFLKKYIL